MYQCRRCFLPTLLKDEQKFFVCQKTFKLCFISEATFTVSSGFADLNDKGYKYWIHCIIRFLLLVGVQSKCCCRVDASMNCKEESFLSAISSFSWAQFVRKWYVCKPTKFPFAKLHRYVVIYRYNSDLKMNNLEMGSIEDSWYVQPIKHVEENSVNSLQHSNTVQISKQF